MHDRAVPDGWRIAKLGECITLEYGFGLPDRQRRPGSVPVYGSNGVLGYHHAAAVNGPGIIVGRKGSIGSVRWSETSFWPIDTTYWAKIRLDDQVDLRWAYYYLHHLRLARLNAATGVPGLNRSEAATLLTLLPPLPEQRKIADILSSEDDAIEKTETVIEQVRRVKQGLAQQLLTRGLPGRHTRFKQTEVGEIPDEWQLVRIQDLASDEPRSVQSGPFGSSLRHSEFQDTGVLVIGIDNVLDGRFSMGSQHRISYQKFEELRQYEARPLDVLITVMATVGRSCLVPPDLERAIITKHVYRITVDRSRCDPWFLMWCFLYSPVVLKQLYGSAQGQTRPGLNGRLIKRVRLPLPRLDEQTEIGELLVRMDTRIDREEIALRALQHTKSAVMHVLLTGQVRVKVPTAPSAPGEDRG